MMAFSAVFTSCTKDANDAAQAPLSNSTSFDIEGVNYASTFNMTELKQAIVNQLHAEHGDEFNKNELERLIQVDQIAVYGDDEGYVVVAEWVDDKNVSMGYASRVIGQQDQAPTALEGGCISRGCSCTLKLCSCLSTTGECERPWSPPNK